MTWLNTPSHPVSPVPVDLQGFEVGSFTAIPTDIGVVVAYGKSGHLAVLLPGSSYFRTAPNVWTLWTQSERTEPTEGPLYVRVDEDGSVVGVVDLCPRPVIRGGWWKNRLNQ